MKTPYDILKRPIITEKSSYQSSSLHQYVFEVDINANRSEVKDAVEKVFDVKVLKVNTVIAPAKRGRSVRNRRTTIRKSAYKKAIVTVAPEDRIPIFEGVE